MFCTRTLDGLFPSVLKPSAQTRAQNIVQIAQISLGKCCAMPKFQGYRVSFAHKKYFEDTMKRKFTGEYLKEHGDQRLESVKMILSTRQQPPRKVSDYKRTQLATLYERALIELMAGDEVFKGILITKIQVPPLMHKIVVHWRCTGNAQRDQDIEDLLNEQESLLRHRLSQACYSTSIQRLAFERDKQHLLEHEMNKLFEKADYGVQYRALSQVANVLGSVDSDAGGLRPVDPEKDPGAPKKQPPPFWIQNWRRRAKGAEAENRDPGPIPNQPRLIE